MPLVRYRIGDTGRVMTMRELTQAMRQCGQELPADLTASSSGHFIALHGRTDVVCTFYALNIYPDNIKAGLENPDIEHEISGKFVLAVEQSDGGDQQLRLTVELRPGANDCHRLRERVTQAVMQALRQTNAEYRHLERTQPSRCVPDIVLLPHGDPAFEIAVKHRWISS